MLWPIKDRPLTDVEVERMRLILSTYRDGSGQQMLRTGESMPGFRDFERATALVCGGYTPENKGVFDVLVPVPGGLPYGISCKSAVTQPAASQAAFMEMSNSAKKFADEFDRLDIDWTREPDFAGIATVDLVRSWHEACWEEVDLGTSRYLILAHDRRWTNFELLILTLDLYVANPRYDVEWFVEGRNKPSSIAGYINNDGVRHRLWQLYPNSGGQLKYYPPLSWMDWRSGKFELEEPPVRTIRERVEEYFPGQWPEDY